MFIPLIMQHFLRDLSCISVRYRYLSIICSINRAVDDRCEPREHDFVSRRQTFVLSVLRDLHGNMRIFSRLLSRRRCITRARWKIKRSIISVALSFLPASDKRRRPRQAVPRNGCFQLAAGRSFVTVSSCAVEGRHHRRYDLILLLWIWHVDVARFRITSAGRDGQ